MSDDVLEQLRRENPVPETMPALPIGPVLARLDTEPSAGTTSPGVRPRRARPVIRAIPIALSVAVALAVALAAVTVGGHHRSSRPPGSHRSTAPSKGSSGQSHQTSGPQATAAGRYLIDLLFPASGADWAAGGQLRAFTLRVRIKAEMQCLAAAGLPGPPVDYGQWQPPFGTQDMPNLPVIKRTMNVGVTTAQEPTNPAKSLSPTKRTAYTAALSRCSASAQATDAFESNRRAIQLQGEWLNIAMNIFSTPAVRAANRRGAACSHQTPFPAQSTGSEISNIEAKLTPLNIKGHNAQAKAVNANGVRVLVKCFGAVVALSDRLTAARRVRFLAQHAHAIQQLKAQADRVVAADEAKYAIKLTDVSTVGTVPIGIGGP